VTSCGPSSSPAKVPTRCRSALISEQIVFNGVVLGMLCALRSVSS
jgi:hypothetical protein